MASKSERRKRTVVNRLLASYALLFIAFSITVTYSFRALRDTTRGAEILRRGYVPLVFKIGEAVAEQNVLTVQLNHITAAKNPGDVREWIETSRRTRPVTFAHIREVAEKGLTDEDPSIQELKSEVVREVSAIEKLVSADPERFNQLYQAIAANNQEAAENARAELAKRANEGAGRLRAIKDRIEERMRALSAEAERREARSLQLLISLFVLTMLVSIAISLYARRVLAPLTRVTERAKAVARGDLTPHEVVATNDEIGELATTFEGMVAAIQRARSELINAERLAAIGKMAAHVTHEIRNPLSSIGLNLELLEEEVATTDNKEAAQLLIAIKAEVERLSRIAEQYLSISRRPRPNLVRERLDDLVRELVSFIKPELDRHNVTSDIITDADLPDASLDESQLRQALLNLIRNAREAMSKGGELILTLHKASDGGIDLFIEDTGPGIPEELRASIFDPFFTTKQRGTGLGLAVTRDIIESHGGTIRCEGRASQGTRFVVHLPPPQDNASSAVHDDELIG